MWSKNKIYVGIIPLFTTFCFVGSGFGFWVFYYGVEGPLTKEQGVSINISEQATLGHFANEHNTQVMPTFMLFEEGNSSNDLNQGLNFYKSAYSDITGQEELYQNDKIDIVCHKEVNNFPLPSDVKFVIGANIYINTDYSVDKNAVPLTKYVKISNELYEGSSFVNLLDRYSYTVSEPFIDDSATYGGIEVVEYKIVINLSDIFSYASIDVKPTTLDKYKALYSDYKKYGQYWRIDIQFTAKFEEVV